MVCNPEDTDVKLRMPVGWKEVLKGKLFSPVGSRAFFFLCRKCPCNCLCFWKEEWTNFTKWREDGPFKKQAKQKPQTPRVSDVFQLKDGSQTNNLRVYMFIFPSVILGFSLFFLDLYASSQDVLQDAILRPIWCSSRTRMFQQGGILTLVSLPEPWG